MIGFRAIRTFQRINLQKNAHKQTQRQANKLSCPYNPIIKDFWLRERNGHPQAVAFPYACGGSLCLHGVEYLIGRRASIAEKGGAAGRNLQTLSDNIDGGPGNPFKSLVNFSAGQRPLFPGKPGHNAKLVFLVNRRRQVVVAER